MILQNIIAHKKKVILREKEAYPLEVMVAGLGSKDQFNFSRKLAEPGVSLIAEVKKASPSKGVLREDFNPASIASCYEVNGAVAVSVLTEDAFFQGSLEHLRQVRATVNLPLLRKDFIIDSYQVVQAAFYGADAILLIASILGEYELRSLICLSRELGLDALIEVHNQRELEKALTCGASLIGINNRDLTTFHTDIATTLALAPLVPDNCLLISESGITSAEDVQRLAEIGVDGILVGEALITSSNMELKVRELTGR